MLAEYVRLRRSVKNEPLPPLATSKTEYAEPARPRLVTVFSRNLPPAKSMVGLPPTPLPANTGRLPLTDCETWLQLPDWSYQSVTLVPLSTTP